MNTLCCRSFKLIADNNIFFKLPIDEMKSRMNICSTFLLVMFKHGCDSMRQNTGVGNAHLTSFVNKYHCSFILTDYGR